MKECIKKKVSKTQFETFIKDYPLKLEIDVAHIYDPPVKTYNDFSEGKVWPDSVVAYINLNENDLRFPGVENEYFIFE